ncbi:hypothetical protein ACIRPK_34825 [Kitasatospora sp. NPDC101801]|uniref:hypothetical protein n=1 Tax=Kitasatospora sp. NPDC101801 TaxID=3364103 RepID=UPI003800D840
MPDDIVSLLMTEEQIAALSEGQVRDLAHRLARRAFRPMSTETGSADALARLHVIEHLRRAVETAAAEAAAEAVERGAGYPELGRACDITRQGARRRWPGIVVRTK